MGKYLEIKEYEKELTNIPYPKIKRRYGKRHSELRRYRPDNIGRKISCFKGIVWSNLGGDKPPALITFTMFEVYGIVSAYKSFSVCLQRLRKSLKDSFRYIAVPEFQKRGAVHFHLIIWGLPDEIIYDEAPHWEREEDIGDLGKVKRGNRYLQNLWQRGFVDCLPTDGDPKLAGYLSKYLSKAMSDERLFSQKSYVCSRNILRPVSFTLTEKVGDQIEIEGVNIPTTSPIRDVEYQTRWLGKCHNRLIKHD
jgi:hypothetical protein